MRFQDKTVLVTGGARGIGEAIVRGFHREGAQVMISDLLEDEGRTLAEALSREGAPAGFVRTDVSDPGSVCGSVEETVSRFGKLDVLVNNAGIGQPGILTEDLPVEFWDRVIGINLSGPFYFAKFALPHLRKTGGNIVNIASAAAFAVSYQLAAYNASKTGVLGLTRSIAYDYAKLGVRCNAVAPGPCETALWGSLANLSQEEQAEIIRRESGPVDRFAKPEEIAGAVLFLASEEAGYITGAALCADGGYTMV